MPRFHFGTVLWWVFVLFLLGYVFTNPAMAGHFVHTAFTSAITFAQTIASG
jgi:hypothetical protein